VILLRLFLLEHHVAVLDGVEDITAKLALDELSVFIARDDAHLRMLASAGIGVERRNERIFTRPGEAVNGVAMNFLCMGMDSGRRA